MTKYIKVICHSDDKEYILKKTTDSVFLNEYLEFFNSQGVQDTGLSYEIQENVMYINSVDHYTKKGWVYNSKSTRSVRLFTLSLISVYPTETPTETHTQTQTETQTQTDAEPIELKPIKSLYSTTMTPCSHISWSDFQSWDPKATNFLDELNEQIKKPKLGLSSIFQ